MPAQALPRSGQTWARASRGSSVTTVLNVQAPVGGAQPRTSRKLTLKLDLKALRRSPPDNGGAGGGHGQGCRERDLAAPLDGERRLDRSAQLQGPASPGPAWWDQTQERWDVLSGMEGGWTLSLEHRMPLGYISCIPFLLVVGLAAVASSARPVGVPLVLTGPLAVGAPCPGPCPHHSVLSGDRHIHTTSYPGEAATQG